MKRFGQSNSAGNPQNLTRCVAFGGPADTPLFSLNLQFEDQVVGAYTVNFTNLGIPIDNLEEVSVVPNPAASGAPGLQTNQVTTGTSIVAFLLRKNQR